MFHALVASCVQLCIYGKTTALLGSSSTSADRVSACTTAKRRNHIGTKDAVDRVACSPEHERFVEVVPVVSQRAGRLLPPCCPPAGSRSVGRHVVGRHLAAHHGRPDIVYGDRGHG